MAKRRKYDTEALVDRMKAERRTGIMLVLAGVFVLFFIVGLYIISTGDDGGIPEIDKEVLAAANVDAPESPAEVPDEPPVPAEQLGVVEEQPVVRAKEPVSEEPVSQEPVRVIVSLSRKGILFVDDKKIGRTKRTVLRLAPGGYDFRAKFGKRMVRGRVQIDPGGPTTVRVDLKKRRVTAAR